MSIPTSVLTELNKESLIRLNRKLGLESTARSTVKELAAGLARFSDMDAVLAIATGEDLRLMCAGLGIATSGDKASLAARVRASIETTASTRGGTDAAPSTPAPQGQAWLAFPSIELSQATASAPVAMRAVNAPVQTTEGDASEGDDVSPPEDGREVPITVDVSPRKPRLAWHGMRRREIATSVPTQVVEIVRPGRAVERGSELGLEARQVVSRDVSSIPPNRLIWTNDNLVALQTLLDERDPTTRDYRYRGKVDLVYIDPPFMVNNDFRADNAIEIEIDEDEGVQARKEPSLVEILAYKDTWRQGLDSFLSMIRRRLELLKQLLAPTGSIYVHLDWHAVHYVKVLMDEIFGYDAFRNEIIWKRSSAHSDLTQGADHYGRSTDTILFYSNSGATLNPMYVPYDPTYIAQNYKRKDPDGRVYRIDNIQGPGGAAKGNPYYEFMGVSRYWRYSKTRMHELQAAGRIIQTSPGAVPQYKRYLDEMPGVPLQNLWNDIAFINNRSDEASGYPTQKPVSLLERIIAASSPAGGLVLDCFAGSGTTCEAAERLGRAWIGVDNGKFAIHLTRKRLITMHGEARSHAASFDYDSCEACGTSTRKARPSRSNGVQHVRPFTVENMGVYQRAEQWQDFQTQRSRYRDEMIKVFGGEVVHHSPVLHGKKSNSWVHVGPLDGPISSSQVWSIAREAQRTPTKRVTVLAADFDTLSGSEKDEVKAKTGVEVTVRIIPGSAIDEVRRRLEMQRASPDEPIESMAIPAFYAPLSIILSANTSGRTVKAKLDRCEIDIESFIASQRPVLKSATAGTPAAKKKAQSEINKWDTRRKVLEKWLAKATSWQKFIDYWAIDWDYGARISPEAKPIFETDWQSFKVRRGRGDAEALTFVAEFKYPEPGRYTVAARVTDVFGNDGIATVAVEVA